MSPLAAPVGPVAPVAPVAPAAPAAPVAPWGIVKSSTAASGVPVFVTVACVPGCAVVTVPTVTVAAAPAAPVGPVGAVTYGICLFVCPWKSAGAFEMNL